MQTKYLSLPLDEIRAVVLREQALIHFDTQDLSLPDVIRLETPSTQFASIKFSYVYQAVPQSFIQKLFKRKRYNIIAVSSRFGLKTFVDEVPSATFIDHLITTVDESYKPLKHIYPKQYGNNTND